MQTLSSEAFLLEQFAQVRRHRQRRNGNVQLGQACLWVKTYQGRRFRHTYADLLEGGPYQAASEFFLQELYGPQDFTKRDEQFERVIPALTRIFPQNIVNTVACMIELHALSEELDTAMAEAICAMSDGNAALEAGPGPSHTGDAGAASLYQAAWLRTSRREDRHKQLALTLQLGRRLDRLTRISMLRMSLKLMRGPARRAGLEALQAMLEAGFDTFYGMGGAEGFLALVNDREEQLLDFLFSSETTERLRLLP